MPNINTMKESRFLKKEDCGPSGILVTIRGCEQMNVAKEGAPEELKWCLTFEETDKPMVVNSTNLQIIAATTGSQETESWPGHKVVLFNDPSISFAGKLTGGIRVRAPRSNAAPAVPTRTAPAPARMPAEKLAQIPSAEPDPEDVPF